MFIKDGRLNYVYNFLGIKPEQDFVSPPLSPGKHSLGMEFKREKAGEHGESLGKTVLYVDGKPVAEGPMKAQIGKVTLSPTDAKPLTLRALLTHTSGLFSYEKDATFVAWQHAAPSPKTPDELVRLSLVHTPSARVGAPYAYANTNSVLVARLLELVEGASLASQLEHLATETLDQKVCPRCGNPYGESFCTLL
jgi:hypothetical protein